MSAEYQFNSFGYVKTGTQEELAALETDSDAVIVLDRGVTDGNRSYWAYIAIRPSLYSRYVRAVKAGETILFSDFGKILAYGFDKDVPSAIKEKKKQTYGCDDSFEENLANAISQARDAFLEQKKNRINNILGQLRP